MKNILSIIFMAIALVFSTTVNGQIRTVESYNNEKIWVGSYNDSFRILESIEGNDTIVSLYIPCKNEVSNDVAMFILGHSKTEAINEMAKLKNMFNSCKVDDKFKLIDNNNQVITIYRGATTHLTEKMKSNPRMLNKWTAFYFYCDSLPGYVERNNYSMSLTKYFSKVNGNVEELFEYYLTQMYSKMK